MDTTSTTHLPPTRITDPSFLEGLKVVLEPYYSRNAPQEEIEAVVQRAETFFLSTRADLDLEQTQPLSTLTSVPPASASSAPAAPSSSIDAPYPPTFSELAHLIATGAPIPGIRDIPDRLAEGAPSEATREAVRKPWERTVGEETAGAVGIEGQGEGGEENS
ncbi:hypothetical protein JCM10207_006528 [Rhodosporidiobolus poonsookiae]